MRRFLDSTPRQTFVLFPAITLATRVLARGRPPRVRAGWLPLLAAGYGLYRLGREYRRAMDAGPTGFAQPPKRLLVTGPYALSRNPMYLGHLLFLAGLVGATRSPVAAGLLVAQYLRLRERIRVDEARLERIFGDSYRAYRARVPRWLGTIRSA